MERKHYDTNEFEGMVKIRGYPSKESLIEKIDSYLNKYKEEGNEAIYEIEKETSNYILLNFHKNTELANLVIRRLKLLQMSNNKNFANLSCHLSINVINPNQKKEDEEKKEKNEQNEKKVKKLKKADEIYKIDTKNNPRLNKLLSKSLNFNRQNINKYLSPNNNKMKIYESIFLNGGYVDRDKLAYKEVAKNKAQWINKKGFIPYISKNTILKNAHMIENYLSLEPAQSNNFNFRPVQKTKWVGKTDFCA